MGTSESESSSEDQVVAERNRAIGLWAGRKIGFKGRQLNAYVLDVMRADRHIPGPDDIVDKIAFDFIAHGVPFETSDIEQQIQRQERLTRQAMVAKT